jgi:hypothetical protein
LLSCPLPSFSCPPLFPSSSVPPAFALFSKKTFKTHQLTIINNYFFPQ